MRLRFPLAVLFTLLSPLVAQDAASSQEPLRIHVIGASVSAGFRDGPMFGAEEKGDSVTLQQVLKRWTGDHARATTHREAEMLGMFTDATRLGAMQIAAVEKAKPDVVVAVDFAFWFAYGYVDGDEATARKEKFAAGLDLLRTLEMPVLLGDLPDMQGAAVRMLRPAQIPSPKVLAELNAQLAEFAKQHANVRLLPLASLVKQMKHEGAVLPLAAGPLQTPPGALLQGDKLHANRLGMALLGYTLQEPLRAALPAGNPLREQKWTFEEFVAAAVAEADLEAVRAAAPKAGAAAPQPKEPAPKETGGK